MDRDLKNVYDLSVSQNLEEMESRFAAKLEELAQPCSVDEFGGDAGEGGDGDFTGTFLETGVRQGTEGVESKKLILQLLIELNVKLALKRASI